MGLRYKLIILASIQRSRALKNLRMRNLPVYHTHNGGKLNTVANHIMAIQVNRQSEQEQQDDLENFGPQLVGKLEVRKVDGLVVNAVSKCPS